MKRFISLLLLLLAQASAFALNEPVPDTTPLVELPKGSKVLVLRDLHFKFAHGISSESSLSESSDFVFYENRSVVRTGETFLIRKVQVEELAVIVSLPLEKGYLYLSRKPFVNVTVGEFRRMFDSSVRIVFDAVDTDPFPDAEGETKRDLLMARVVAAIKADKHRDAIPDFARLEKLGVALPESFYYYYIVALDKSDMGVDAKKRGMSFLQRFGKKSKYYGEVLAITAK